MLKVRLEHLSALAARQYIGFIERMRLHLRDVFPEEVAGLNDAKLDKVIERICAQGEQWGITEETLAERLIELFVSFEQLRRKPLPQWIEEIVSHPGRRGARILVMLENRLQFQGRSVSTESSQEATTSLFCRKVDRALCEHITNEKGVKLSPDLIDASGKGRSITMAGEDRAYRKKWNAIARQMRKSRAIPRKTVRSAYITWRNGAQVNFPPVLLAAKRGGSSSVPLKAGRVS